MKKNLSILIPTFNDACLQLVSQLNEQATHIDGLAYEILVADDGSTDASVVETNRQINALPHCRYIRFEENKGRSVIRNILAETAHYDWLLFVDGDMSVAREDFIRKYVETEGSILYGGYVVKGNEEQLKGNLRFIYEKKSEPAHTFDRRQQNPYFDFHTSNYLIARRLYEQHPLDARFRHYGYEDVLMGKQLQEADIPITHIDNPLAFATFEDNPHFVQKTEEGLRTLATFKDELEGYSRLLAFTQKAKRTGIDRVITFVYKMMSDRWRRRLCGNHPSLNVFKWYKLGYLLQLLAQKQA